MSTPRRIEGSGTPEAAWRAWDSLARAPRQALAEWLAADQRLVVVSPHPDDEILAGGALASQHAHRGGTVHVVAVTDGEASHRGVPEWSPTRLAAARRQESSEGLARLLGAAPPSPLRLNLPDSDVALHADRLNAALLQTLRPEDVVVTTWRLDGHPDHEACGAAAAAAAAAVGCRLLEAPVWMWHWAEPDDPRVPWERLRHLTVPADTAARLSAAIEAHATQLAPRGAEGPVLTPAILERLGRDAESFSCDAVSDSMPHDRADFESLFAEDDDPWRFRSRWYEERKRALTLAALPERRYASGYEPGCANGELSAALATRCDRLLISDGAERAVAAARRRTADLPQVRVVQAWLPGDWPDGRFDLVVVSELLYYLDADAVDALARRLLASLTPGGTVLACHWRRPIAGCAEAGDAVQERLGAALGLPRLLQIVDADLRLEVWSRDDRSVAEREGLA